MNLLNDLIDLAETLLRWAAAPVLVYTVYLIVRELLKGKLKEAFLKGAIGVGAALFLIFGPNILFTAFKQVDETVKQEVNISDIVVE